ncbi:MAG: hypothetical protein CSA86_01280 [Arcobacter sp.]|nr:MAG: hypothetical protein CSA86_01280 [Arcobacter sp.]
MLDILNVAQSGLKVSQTQVENVMNNLANENTPGYKKRVVNVEEMDHIDSRKTGRGVETQNVSRITDIYMYQNLITEESQLSSMDELNSMLGDIEAIFKETDISGMSADINRYFKSIENLRTSPQNEIYKNDLANSARVIVSNLKEMYAGIEEVETSTLLGIKENVTEVNNILKEIGNISEKLVKTTSNSPNDLLDKRDHLEKELAKFVDVEIFRGEHYQLKIAGVTAVRFDTNVHEIKLVEDYVPQKDVYARTQVSGNAIVTVTDADGNFESPIKEAFGATGLDNVAVAEVQEIEVSGIATKDSISFLGTTITTAIGDDAATVVANISVQNANIISAWNSEHPNQEIDSITYAGTQIEITYKEFEGDVPAIDNVDINGISFTGSVETTKGVRDSITYTLNNEHSVTVTLGEEILDDYGNPVDITGDGSVANNTVTKDNILQALIYQINNDRDIGGKIKAYNGNYQLTKNGNKILSNNLAHSNTTLANQYADKYLVIESQVPGEEGKFVGEVTISDSLATADPLKPEIHKEHISNNKKVSQDALDDVHLEIYDKEITLSSGALKPMIDNVKTDSGANIFNQYKEKLDQFSKTLSDLTDAYIENPDQSYIYGTDAVELSSEEDRKVSLNLFSGANVKSLRFNKDSLDRLTQDNLDYLATIQWKEDIKFDSSSEDEQSFSQFYQALRVDVADNKENVVFKQGAQAAVKESMENAYAKLTKVDNDEEMILLIKFQSAYSANAKMITVVDEMLQTLLGLKR